MFAELGLPLDAEDVRQSVEMRKIHEISAIRLACERRSAENLARLGEILEEEERKALAGDNIAEDDRIFHSEIIRATQNTVFFRIVNIFYVISKKRRTLYFQSADRCRRSHGEHVGMVEAIQRQDAELATSLMEAHLAGCRQLLARLDRQDDDPPETCCAGWPSCGRLKRPAWRSSSRRLRVTPAPRRPSRAPACDA